MSRELPEWRNLLSMVAFGMARLAVAATILAALAAPWHAAHLTRAVFERRDEGVDARVARDLVNPSSTGRFGVSALFLSGASIDQNTLSNPDVDGISFFIYWRDFYGPERSQVADRLVGG